MFKLFHANEADIPADQKAHYEKRDDGKWWLKVEGAAEKSKLDEFRENNRKLTKQVEEITEKYKDLDIEKVRELLKRQGELDEKELIKKGDIEGIVAKRVEALKTDHGKEITKYKTELEKTTGQLSVLLIDNGVTGEGLKKGVIDTALPDLTRRARETFQVKDGKLVAMNGDQQLFGRDGTTPLTIGEWLEKQVVDAPHLFKGNQGGGAGGGGQGGGGGTGGKVNPWKPETFNMTQQMEIIKADKKLADRMRQEAGVPVK